MAFKTIKIKESAYRALAKRKQPRESFLAVIEREMGTRVDTGQDLLDLIARRRASGLEGLGFSARRKRRRLRSA